MRASLSLSFPPLSLSLPVSLPLSLFTPLSPLLFLSLSCMSACCPGETRQIVHQQIVILLTCHHCSSFPSAVQIPLKKATQTPPCSQEIVTLTHTRADTRQVLHCPGFAASVRTRCECICPSACGTDSAGATPPQQLSLTAEPNCRDWLPLLYRRRCVTCQSNVLRTQLTAAKFPQTAGNVSGETGLFRN